MIYLIGGAPRSGKSILAQRFAFNQRIGWVSTDLLLDMLRAADVEGIKTEWDASPQAIATSAEWFFPYLERFTFGASSLADHDVVEGVDILPAQVVRLAKKYPLRAVFLGCSRMTLDRFDRFPGRSRGYANLPDADRRRFADDIPRWSAFIQQEARHFNLPFVDTADDFLVRLDEAEAILLAGSEQ